MTDAVRVTGLREFKAGLKQAGDEFPKMLRQASFKAATVVADATRASFASRGGSAPKVAPTVKALASQNRAQVKVGGGNSIGGAVAMGQTWGSRKYRQFPPPVAGGYSLYPSIAAKRDEVEAVYLREIDEITKKAFPD